VHCSTVAPGASNTVRGSSSGKHLFHVPGAARLSICERDSLYAISSRLSRERPGSLFPLLHAPFGGHRGLSLSSSLFLYESLSPCRGCGPNHRRPSMCPGATRLFVFSTTLVVSSLWVSLFSLPSHHGTTVGTACARERPGPASTTAMSTHHPSHLIIIPSRRSRKAAVLMGRY